MIAADRQLRVLHVLGKLGPTNAQYHEHCLPLLGQRRFVLCSLLPATFTPAETITVFAGNGSRRGAWRALRSALRHEQYDVVHAHVPVAAALLAAATLTDPRVRRRSVYSMTNSYRSYKRRNRLLLYPVFAVFPEVVLCSDAVRDSLPRLLSWLARWHGTVVANGADTAQIRDVVARVQQPAPVGRGMTVVSVSRLVAIKDPLTLLRAFALVREPADRLVFVGDGPMHAVLAAAVHDAGLAAQVELAGLVPRDEVYRRVALADVYVSMSHGEGLPVAVLEAMACGTPVVLSDIAPHREIARQVAGLPLVAPGDVDGLARHLVRIREMRPDQRIELGARGQQVVEQQYGVATMHRRLETVYDRVRGNTRRGDHRHG